MLSRNMRSVGLVNGSRGVVESFIQGDQSSPVYPVVRFDSGQYLVMQRQEEFCGLSGDALLRLQFPLKLAWALTVHKSQGMTLSRAEVDVIVVNVIVVLSLLLMSMISIMIVIVTVSYYCDAIIHFTIHNINICYCIQFLFLFAIDDIIIALFFYLFLV